MSIFWIWLTGGLFGLLHSLMAANPVKAALYERGIGIQAYRLTYSLLAIVLTGAWLVFVHLLPDVPLYRLEGWQNWLMLGLQITGLIIAVFSFRAFDAGMFLGFKTMPEDGEPFHEQGVYRLIRHPMYSGVMLALLASPVQTLNSFNLTLVICLYFIIGSRFEERRMLAEHPQYADYRRRVRAFIPRLGAFHRRHG